MTKRELMEWYKGKRVLVTGHTGFKGSWLIRILEMAGAEVTGYSLEAPTEPSLFELAGYGEDGQDEKGKKREKDGQGETAENCETAEKGEKDWKKNGVRTIIGDIRDFDRLREVFGEAKPEIVLHLAAQPIVRTSYKEPRMTYETNVMGTVNICECVRLTSSVKSFLNVTTDKVYQNKEWAWGYRENEPLDGYDPYSNSKSCSELVTHSYINSFFKDAGIPVSTARAGNVIGGGDFAADRIIPDCVRAVEAGKPIIIRNPNSTRPYQHVLEPLFLYLQIAAEQYQDPSKAGFYNVGPDECDCVTTGELVDLFGRYYGEGFEAEVNHDPKAPHEANFLKLDTSLVKKTFGWKPTWHIDEAIEETVAWTRAWMADPGVENIRTTMADQIGKFVGE